MLELADLINQTWCCDCLDFMPLIPDRSVDMVLCDLPYGTTQNKWDSVIPFEALWAQYRRILKPGGVVVLSAAQPFTSAVVTSNLPWFKYEWIWEKTQAVGHLNAYKQPMRKHESILVFAPGKAPYTPQVQPKDPRNIRPATRGSQTENYNAFDVTAARKVPSDMALPTSVLVFANVQRGVHPTQKPVALWEYLIRTYTNEGDTALDNCCGSGTTGIACRNTGRNFIQIDISEQYCEIAERRLSAGKELKKAS